MKTEILKLIILLSITGVFLSCNNVDLTDPVAQKAIEGKWEKIAEGEYRNKINPYTPDGTYIEYLSNGTFRIWVNELSSFNVKGTYKIYSDSLVTYSGKNRLKSCYLYSFNEDTLTLVDLTCFTDGLMQPDAWAIRNDIMQPELRAIGNGIMQPELWAIYKSRSGPCFLIYQRKN